MPGIRFAEWLLRRTTSAENASAQLGDLLELAQSRGPLWFWRNLLAAFAYAAYRPTLAFTIAFLSSTLVEYLWNHGLFGNRPDLNSVHTIGALFLVPFTLVPIYSLLRFGWSDTCARLSLLFALALSLFTAGAFALYPRPAFYADLLPIPAAILALLLTRRWKTLRPFAQLASAVAINLIAVVGLLTLFFVVSFALSAWFHAPTFAFGLMQALATHPLCDLVNACVFLLIIRTSNRIRDPRPLHAIAQSPTTNH